MEKLRAKYAPKLAVLEEQRRKAQQRADKEKSASRHQILQTVLSVGESVLAVLMSRKMSSAANVKRVGTSVRQASKWSKGNEDAAQAEETVDAIAARKTELEDQLKQETQALQKSADADTMALETVTVQPKKSDINVTHVVLVWVPYANADGKSEPLVTL
jgi:hypothetical protein